MTWISSGEAVVQKQRGRWVVRQPGYDGATGKRRPRQVGTFATKREALATARRVGPGGAGSGSQTLEVFLTDVWLRAMESKVEASKLAQYRRVVGKEIVPLLGAVRLKHVDQGLINAWVIELSSAPAGGEPALDQGSVHAVREVLSMAFDDAIRLGLVSE